MRTTKGDSSPPTVRRWRADDKEQRENYLLQYVRDTLHEIKHAVMHVSGKVPAVQLITTDNTTTPTPLQEGYKTVKRWLVGVFVTWP